MADAACSRKRARSEGGAAPPAAQAAALVGQYPTVSAAQFSAEQQQQQEQQATAAVRYSQLCRNVGGYAAANLPRYTQEQLRLAAAAAPALAAAPAAGPAAAGMLHQPPAGAPGHPAPTIPIDPTSPLHLPAQQLTAVVFAVLRGAALHWLPVGKLTRLVSERCRRAQRSVLALHEQPAAEQGRIRQEVRVPLPAGGSSLGTER